ncbi:hypothetical protein [Anaerorhabdus furcosa]|uniref:Cell division protein FtsL n=1 Tax=Anaerorhabdus furcosa TaxID=118967 RepID=A0A1T4P086_9FIRM|nr:hypothetical protein [Anaerorhabdus furcosa]SJZ84747.1 cell division protein FtsL [Anaerorhabdus furcosa]
MAKIVKKKKVKKLRLQNFTVVLFLFAALSSLGSSLFLRSYNNSLSVAKQKIDVEIASYQTENEAVKVEIQTLSSRDRVESIANDAGLGLDQNNIVTIANGE